MVVVYFEWSKWLRGYATTKALGVVPAPQSCEVSVRTTFHWWLQKTPTSIRHRQSVISSILRNHIRVDVFSNKLILLGWSPLAVTRKAPECIRHIPLMSVAMLWASPKYTAVVIILFLNDPLELMPKNQQPPGGIILIPGFTWYKAWKNCAINWPERIILFQYNESRSIPYNTGLQPGTCVGFCSMTCKLCVVYS